MKLNGESLRRISTGMVVLPRYDLEGDLAGSLSMVISALPMNWHLEALAALPEPQPPKDFARKPGSNRLQKDEDGKPFYVTNHEDPQFLLAEARHAKRYNAWVFYEALRADSRYEFENQKPDGLTPQSAAVWLDALIEEMSSDGFCEGDIAIIIAELSKLGNISGEAIEEARALFLVKKSPGKDGSSPSE